MSNHEAAQVLGISVDTVRAHLREIFSKLDIRRRGQLAAIGEIGNGGSVRQFDI